MVALAVVALDALSLGLVLPVLLNLVALILHGSASQTSFYVRALFALYVLMQFLYSPVVGGLSDRFGRRPVMLVSLFMLGVMTLFWVWVGSIGWLFVIRILSGVFASNISTASAYIGDITPADKRAQYFGLVGAMFGVGFVLGPIAGGILGQHWIRLPFVAAAALIFCDVLYGSVMLRESLPPEKRRAFAWRRANPFGSLAAIKPGQQRLVFTLCCLWLMVAAHLASFILTTEVRFGWNTLQNGLILGIGGIFQIGVMAGLVPVATRRWGERVTALIGLVFCVAAYLLLAFAVTPTIVIVGVLVLSFSTLASPPVQAMLSIEAGEAHQGGIQGALSSLQGLMLVSGRSPWAACLPPPRVAVAALVVLSGFCKMQSQAATVAVSSHASDLLAVELQDTSAQARS